MKNLNELPPMPVSDGKNTETEIKTNEDLADDKGSSSEDNNKTEKYETMQEGIDYLVIQQEIANDFRRIENMKVSKDLLRIVSDFEKLDDQELKDLKKEINGAIRVYISELAAFRSSAGVKDEKYRKLAKTGNSFEGYLLKRIDLLIQKLQDLDVDGIDREKAMDLYSYIRHVEDVFLGVSLVSLRRH